MTDEGFDLLALQVCKVLMFVYGLEWLWLNVVLSILVSGLDHFFDYRLLALSYYRFG